MGEGHGEQLGESHTTNGAVPAVETGGWTVVQLAPRRPGYSGRLSIAGLVVIAQAAFTIWSLGLVELAHPRWIPPSGACGPRSHPGPFAFQDVPLVLAAAFGVVLPAAIAGVIGGILLIRDQSRRLAIGLTAVWLVVGVGFAVAGGVGDLGDQPQALIACLVVSGATSCPRPRTASEAPCGGLALRVVRLDVHRTRDGDHAHASPDRPGAGSDFIRKPAPMSVWNDADGTAALSG